MQSFENRHIATIRKPSPATAMEELHQHDRIARIAAADDADPFSFLGMHQLQGQLVVRVFHPPASRVTVVRVSDGAAMGDLPRLHEAGIFGGPVDGCEPCPYRLRLTVNGQQTTVADPYGFGPVLGKLELHAHAQGVYWRAFEKMGAHPATWNGVEGTAFALWAPNALRVSVIGDFNNWDGRRNPMRFHAGAGLWDIFLPGVAPGALYKFEIKTRDGAILFKADPYAFAAEKPPLTASIVQELPPQPAGERRPSAGRARPMAIYEVHLGSWRRTAGEEALTYRQLADTLIPYVKEMGFTHIEVMPVSEHPFGGSWGYQPTGLFAPTSRYGSPSEFRDFVALCHAEGVGLILDWVVGHFPDDAHGLARFDGTHLYEHEDPREGLHREWNTLVYNYGRREVRNYLLANAFFWHAQYGIDGLRVDAVTSMLYRNYGRGDGEWAPNIHGGVENVEAVGFLRRMNELVHQEYPETITIAEEATAWPMVSGPIDRGGLDFGYKWNMGWMHDTLAYFSKDRAGRKAHHDLLTFGPQYAFTENFILPLSHDEVANGKGSLLQKMPGDGPQKFANLRAFLAFMYTQPGKKLLFMGCEFAQDKEWNHDSALDWDCLKDVMHSGVQALVRDLNLLYRNCPALYERDCEASGFSWITRDDAENGVIAYLRQGAEPEAFAIVICNFASAARRYRIGVPRKGRYFEALNTDSSRYGGSSCCNPDVMETQEIAAHGQGNSLVLMLPAFCVIVLRPDEKRAEAGCGTFGQLSR